MLAIWAKHTKIQCASAETCAKCSNVRMLFFSVPHLPENLTIRMKFAGKWGDAHQLPKKVADKNKPYRIELGFSFWSGLGSSDLSFLNDSHS